VKGTYRLATPADLPAWEDRLRAYLLEQEKSSPVRLTRRTLDWYRNLAHSYLKGSLFGVLVLAMKEAEMTGFALGGEDPGTPHLDTNLGRQAVVWLVWVDPAHRQSGLGLGMLSFGRPHLVELGFETAVMSVRAANAEGVRLTEAFGARLEELIYLFPLREEPHHGQR
jgi:ribosomal protein S18 acetylase RimI-like enzyme